MKLKKGDTENPLKSTQKYFPASDVFFFVNTLPDNIKINRLTFNYGRK